MSRQIEIESKFQVTPDVLSQIERSATFVSDKSFRDRYFDTDDFMLMHQDWWLRERDGKWELKCLLCMGGNTPSYEELTTVETIIQTFRGDEKLAGNILQLVESDGATVLDYFPAGTFSCFCDMTTKRTKYCVKDDVCQDICGDVIKVTIDVDECVNNLDGQENESEREKYSIAEVETLVSTEEEVVQARNHVNKILSVISGDQTGSVHGKMTWFLSKRHPHLNVMLQKKATQLQAAVAAAESDAGAA